MMKQSWKKTIGSVAMASGLIATGNIAQADMTITLTGLESTNDAVPTDHGSTSETLLNWDDGWDQYAGWPNDPGNGVYQVDGSTQTIEFTPVSSMFNASVDNFDLNVWGGGGDTNVDWSILDAQGGNVLASGSVSVLDDSVQNVAINYTGGFGESFVLQLDQLSGITSYLAMDNLTFSSTAIPEPASAALLATGLGGFVLRRRRKAAC